MATVAYCCCNAVSTEAWSPNPFSKFFLTSPSFCQHSVFGVDEEDTDVRTLPTNEQVQETRRRFLSAAAMNICLVGAAAPVVAADATGPTRYISGKAPVVPGAKPQDKNNVKGTRKDPDFLRSIADCRSQCQNSASGPDGLAKSKEDCLSECQDICCRTYEQCSFNIVPRI
jgi:hypothetical protein